MSADQADRASGGAPLPAAILTRLALRIYGAVALLCGGWLWWRGELARLLPDPLSRLGELGLARDLAGNVGLGLLLGLGVVVALDRVRGEWGPMRFLEDRLRELLLGLTASQALLLALSSGIAEELLFRGVLQTELARRFGNLEAWLAASALFAALHVGPDRRFLLWTTFSLVAGLLLGALFVATGSLVAPIVLHVAVNGLNLVDEAWRQ